MGSALEWLTQQDGAGVGAELPCVLSALPLQRLQVGDTLGTMRALLCLWLLAETSRASRVRTRRELAPGLYEHGVYDAGGSYCQRGDVCCHGRDDACTVPYHDTLCYCDLFCNRTVSDCCPDFWEYCLGIPPPFPKAPGEAAPGPEGQGAVGDRATALGCPVCCVMLLGSCLWLDMETRGPVLAAGLL